MLLFLVLEEAIEWLGSTVTVIVFSVVILTTFLFTTWKPFSSFFNTSIIAQKSEKVKSKHGVSHIYFCDVYHMHK